MSRPRELKADIIIDYLERFPNIHKLTLAKKIKTETGLVFDSIEDVRSIIRRYTGATGNFNRKNMTYTRFFRDNVILTEDNPYDLPQTDALEYPIFKFPKANDKILIMGDIHSPYHDIPALTCTINWAREHKINTVLFNGDIIDCYQLSSFIKDPRKRRFKEEREILWRLLDRIQNALPDATFYYKIGNHEERYENYLKIKAPEIFDTEEYHLDILLRFGERSIISKGDKIRMKAGKLNILHGHEPRGGNPNVVNPARFIFLKAKESVLVNHFHQSSEHTEPKLTGDLITCFSVGCLCNLNPEFSPINKWGHGFARVLVNEDDTFQVTNLRIHEGKML